MKFKIIALFLALTVASWAQTATQTAPAAPQQSTDKAKCACCDKMAAGEMGDMKDGASCCAHHDMKTGDSKDMASCCAGKDKDKASCCDGKDAKSCKRDSKDKNAKACCGDKCSKDKMAANCCGGKCGKGCCSDNKSEKSANNCCEKQMHS